MNTSQTLSKNIVYFLKTMTSVEEVISHLVENEDMSICEAEKIRSETDEHYRKLQLFEYIVHRIDSQKTYKIFCEALQRTNQRGLLAKLFPGFLIMDAKHIDVFASIRDSFQKLKPIEHLFFNSGNTPVVTISTYRGSDPVSNIARNELLYLYAVKTCRWSFYDISKMDGAPENLRDRYTIYESEINGVVDFIRSIENGGIDVLIFFKNDSLFAQLKTIMSHENNTTMNIPSCITFYDQYLAVHVCIPLCWPDVFTEIELIRIACLLHLVCFANMYALIMRKSTDGDPNCYLINRHAFQDSSSIFNEVDKQIVQQVINVNKLNWFVEKPKDTITRAW